MTSDKAKRAGRPPRNRAMAGGKDAPDIVYEVWRCGPPRGGYPGALPGGLLRRCEPWMQGTGVVAFAGPLRVPNARHVDLDATTSPDIVGDVAQLPELLGGELVDWVFADPPYGNEYNRAMYRTAGKVREGTVGKPYKDDKGSTYWPHRWLSAMGRALKPGGHLLYLDQLCPYGPAGTACVRRAFVFRGTNMRASCLTIFRRQVVDLSRSAEVPSSVPLVARDADQRAEPGHP